jgi:hypothetical protein
VPTDFSLALLLLRGGRAVPLDGGVGHPGKAWPDRIAVLVNGHEVARVNDASFSSGQVGMAAFGKGLAVFRDLYVQERP